MKRLLFVIAALALVSCGTAPVSSSEPAPSSESSSGSTSLASSEPSTESTGDSSDPISTDTSEPISTDSTSSVEPPAPGGYVSLLPEHFPAMPGSGFPDDQRIAVGDYSFDISLVGKNVWKNDRTKNVIQMKKADSYISSVSEIYGALTIVAFINSFHDYTSDVDVNATIAPTVTVTHESGEPEVLTSESSEQDGLLVFSYSIPQGVGGFYRIANESSYAQYLADIRWVW